MDKINKRKYIGKNAGKKGKEGKEGINTYLYDKYLDNYGAVCRSFSKVFEERNKEIQVLKIKNKRLKIAVIILALALIGLAIW